LSSPSVSETFYGLAYDLAHSKEIQTGDLDQAVAFLTAALKLDSDSKDIRPLLIEAACRQTERDYAGLVYNQLVDYVDEFADLTVVDKAVAYLLGRLSSRDERQKLLQQMIGTLGSKNTILGSELATRLGLLNVEKGDVQAARFYLLQAYKENRYNKVAFARLRQIAPQEVSPPIYLERLRLAVRENPSDMEAAIAFAQYADKLQLYGTAAAAYQYCVDLFGYLYPSQALPARIYLPWAICAYNTPHGQSKCLDIANRVRKEGGFDLRLEAIAGKAAIKMGNLDLATRTFQAAEQKSQELLTLQNMKQSSAAANNPGGSPPQKVSPVQLAWFYSLALPIPDRALDWANKAYKADPNSPVTAAILAYALVLNKEFDSAKPLVSNDRHNQIADLTLAQIQLTQGQSDLAVKTLNAAIAEDPGSFASERAKEILVQQGKKYIPPIDPNAVLASLQPVFGQALAPVFTAPERAFSGRLDLHDNVLPYGSEFSGAVEIANSSTEPLVISDDGLFKGNIRIDAEVSGDLTMSIPNLVFTRSRTALLIEPGRSMLVPVRLMTGELRRTLLTHPQASLDVEFTLYLDPVKTKDGTIANRITRIKPSTVHIKRPGVELTGQYIREQFNSIAMPDVGQKIKVAQLFTGLIAEQDAMSKGKPLYRYMYADWMMPLLRSALLHQSGLLLNPAPNDWVVKVHTMADMLPLPLDHALLSAVAENLNHAQWPVRMMALYLLAKSQQSAFDKVLEWTARNDPNQSVRDMALALSAAPAGRQGGT
jgi:Tetratricopeptide repeat